MITYFCTKCQKRHPISDISADMWSICKPGLSNKITSLLEDFYDEMVEKRSDELNALDDVLSGFVNKTGTVTIDTEAYSGRVRVNQLFALNSSSMSMIEGRKVSGSTLSGDYTVTLGKIIDLVHKYTTDEDDIEAIEVGGSLLTNEMMMTPVVSIPIMVQFNKHGAVDMVCDKENVPFEMNGTMVGMERICGHCGQQLSRNAGYAEEIVIALAGTPRAGKTSTMIAMVHSLLNNPNNPIRVLPMGHDVQWKNVEKEVELYRRGFKITKTPVNYENAPAYSMLVRLNDSKGTERVLTMIDMPGEFWEGGDGLTAEFFRNYMEVYRNIDCIWYMISKASVVMSTYYNIPHQIVEKLKHETSETEELIQKAHPNMLMNNLSMLKEQFRSTLGKELPPIMVIVTKPDYCSSQVDADETYKYRLFPVGSDNIAQINAQQSRYITAVRNNVLYGLMEKNYYEQAYYVRMYIQEKNKALLDAIESNCPNRSFVALSPYGHPAVTPDSDDGQSGYESNTPETPEAFRELYPVLWTLGITGAVPIVHQVKWMTKGLLGAVTSEETTQEMVTIDFRTEVDPNYRPKRQNERDNLQIQKDICSNMMMQGARFLNTCIDHKRG